MIEQLLKNLEVMLNNVSEEKANELYNISSAINNNLVTIIEDDTLSDDDVIEILEMCSISIMTFSRVMLPDMKIKTLTPSDLVNIMEKSIHNKIGNEFFINDPEFKQILTKVLSVLTKRNLMQKIKLT